MNDTSSTQSATSERPLGEVAAAPRDPVAHDAPLRRVIKRAQRSDAFLHPGLIPGISVEDSGVDFPTRRSVFGIAGFVALAVILWAVFAPENLNSTGVSMQAWVVSHFGWLFNLVVLACAAFMLVIGFGPTGQIKLGADDSEPEHSTFSWISMLFAAGLGIGLIFYGPLEPLSHFMSPPPGSGLEAGSKEAVLPSLGYAFLHQATFPWAIYALVGASLAYASFRRGRLPLISSLFEPVFPDGNNRILGKIIDVSAILVTLFGTATSLGIGVLQIRTGMSLVTGRPLNGSAPLVAIISVLSVVFLISAVTGVKKGIRLLSNTNMGLVVILGLFALIAGPTFFLLDLVPASLISFVGHVPEMFSRYASAGEGEKTWMIAWTSLYWAWWISWSPFVGMFIAKISKGRTLREFTFVVLFAPTSISVLWFTVFGGNAIWQNKEGKGLKVDGAGENVMFDLLRNLPLGNITVVIALAAIVVFFVTAADSATNVMGSMSQSGRPVASTPVTIIWGVLMAATALFLLLAGGRNALSGLQSIMVTSAIIFAVIVIGILVAFARDLLPTRR